MAESKSQNQNVQNAYLKIKMMWFLKELHDTFYFWNCVVVIVYKFNFLHLEILIPYP